MEPALKTRSESLLACHWCSLIENRNPATHRAVDGGTVASGDIFLGSPFLPFTLSLIC